MGDTVCGTAVMVRLELRRSRWWWAAWLLALWGTIAATLGAYERIAPPTTTMAQLAANTTMRAMLGPPFNLFNQGGFVMWRVGTFVAIGAAMMAALGVIRATRDEEEAGRLELMRAAAIGRHAPLLAGVEVTLGGCALLAVMITMTLVVVTGAVGDAVVMGAGIGLVGAVWVGVAAVSAQLFASARSARALALGSLGAAYLLRALADGSTQNSLLRKANWLSPLDWAALARPYAAARPAVMVLPFVLGALLIAGAFALENRRDLSAGLWAQRPGPAHANRWLRGAYGLAWRLERPSIVGWSLGVLLFSGAIGTLSGSFDQLLRDSPQIATILRLMGQGATNLREAFYVAMLDILLVVITALAVQLVARLWAEETHTRTELLLSAAVSRGRYLASHLVIAVATPSLLAVAAGAMLGASQAVAEGSLQPVFTLILAAFALLPGLWIFVGVGTLLLGWVPHLFRLVWVLLAWTVLLVWIGPLLDLPRWLLNLHPFAPLPALPLERFTWPIWALTTAAATAMAVAGAYGYHHRDLR